MVKDARAALDRLIDALEKHYVAATEQRDPDSEDVIETEGALQDAFFAYDQVLFSAVGVELPFDILDEEEEDDDEVFDDDYEFGDDEDDEDAPY